MKARGGVKEKGRDGVEDTASIASVTEENSVTELSGDATVHHHVCVALTDGARHFWILCGFLW
jgi:hypothetical protein